MWKHFIKNATVTIICIYFVRCSIWKERRFRRRHALLTLSGAQPSTLCTAIRAQVTSEGDLPFQKSKVPDNFHLKRMGHRLIFKSSLFRGLVFAVTIMFCYLHKNDSSPRRHYLRLKFGRLSQEEIQKNWLRHLQEINFVPEAKVYSWDLKSDVKFHRKKKEPAAEDAPGHRKATKLCNNTFEFWLLKTEIPQVYRRKKRIRAEKKCPFEKNERPIKGVIWILPRPYNAQETRRKDSQLRTSQLEDQGRVCMAWALIFSCAKRNGNRHLTSTLCATPPGGGPPSTLQKRLPPGLP